MKKPIAKTPPAKTSIAKMIRLLARGMAPTATIASGLLSPQAMSAPGDLDPTFADVGRLGPMLEFVGPAWSIQPGDSADSVVAGGNLELHCTDYYCYYPEQITTGFMGRLSDTGSRDLSFTAAALAHTQVFDVAIQPDGKLIAVGQTVVGNILYLAVVRLTREGALDPTFATGGSFRSPASLGGRTRGTSVVIDNAARIVVAGMRMDSGEPIVLRLLPNGVLDSSFAASGVYTGPSSSLFLDAAHILVTGAGGYRLITPDCQIVALTGNGALDNTFGSAGITTVKAPSGAAAFCGAMVAQPDGRLLVAGNNANGTEGFAERLLANGAEDTSFATDAVATTMDEATALAVSGDGSIVVAGLGPVGVPGAVIMRLQSNGLLDTLFGNAGVTQIDLPSEFGMFPIVHDMFVRPDGGVVAAGGVNVIPTHPFVVRLLGTGGGNGAGVLGVSQQDVIPVTEQSQEAIVKVRRTGGRAGRVSVAYETVAGDPNPATAGQDFTKAANRLTWEDGDTTEKEIRVPILDNESPEDPETFRVMLSDAQGGAGLGTRNATVEIAADGGPFGQFEIGAYSPNPPSVTEPGSVRVWVRRDYYGSGAVSVTAMSVEGTAKAGSDFVPNTAILSWADNEFGDKYVDFVISDDTLPEQDEAFTVKLSNPTGGAILGPRSSVSITIPINDQPFVGGGGGGGGGGGSLGYLSLLVLGVARILQSAWMSARMRYRWNR